MLQQTVTPSQRKAAEERAARLERMRAAARPDKPVACLSASQKAFQQVVAETPELPPVDHFKEWLARQEKLNPLPKPHWFEIVGEIEPTPPAPVHICDIQAACARYWDVGIREILSSRRTARVVFPRQVAMYLAKVHTSRSLPEIGRIFGGRDHTTVLHAVRKISRIVQKDADLAEEIAAIEQTLLEPTK